MARGKQNTRKTPSTKQQNKINSNQINKRNQIAAASKKRPQQQDDEDDSEDPDFLSFNKKGKYDSDEESEQEVFKLNTKKQKDSDDEEESDDASDDDDEDDYDDDEYEQLNQLVNNLPSKLKRDILSGKKVDPNDIDEDDEDEDETDTKKWGKKKTYWTGDTADLEIGQDIEDAVAEEEAARDLQQQKLKRMKQKDFRDDLEEDSEDEEDESEDNADTYGSKLAKKKAADKKAKAKAKKSSDKIAQELEAMVVDHESAELGAVQAEQLAKDISGFSKEQKLELLATHSPELVNIIRELRDRVEELQSKVNPLKALVAQLGEERAEVDDDLVDYLEMKQQLLLSYCLNIVFYLSMKSAGKSLRHHPVMKQLLKLRYAMEKMHALDGKLKYQVDRLVKLSEGSLSKDELKAGLLKPNLSSFLSRTAEDSDEEEDEEADRRPSQQKKTRRPVDSEDEEDDDEDAMDQSDDEDEEGGEVYRAPKMSSTPYPNEREEEKNDRRLERKRNKLRNSELMESIREEFGTTPEMSSSTGLNSANSGDLKRLEDERTERLKFEEERFVRTTLSRKEKKDIKKRLREANRIDNFDDIGDYQDIEELSKLAQPATTVASSSAGSDRLAAAQSAASAKALEKALRVFGTGGDKKKSSALDLLAAEFGGRGDDDEGVSRKRRKAPRPDEDEEAAGGENIFDDFIDKKKEFLAKKKEHYTAEPRFGGVQEEVEDGNKRAISYEILKNRGLTAHKKKSNRNARVKKREAYEKAVKSRKGQVREVITGMDGQYGGEVHGIKANLSRSRKM